jgi:hypothetical protein
LEPNRDLPLFRAGFNVILDPVVNPERHVSCLPATFGLEKYQ